MILWEKLDDLHYTFREIDGYGKDINCVMSPREPGKTTMMWLTKIYSPFTKDKCPWIYLVRHVVEITEALIESIIDVNINKFSDDNVVAHYTKGSFSDGIVDVKITSKQFETPITFFRIVALSIPLRRIKLAVLKNAKGSFMDEWIIDPKTGEKYIPNEWHKIKEAYTTWRRECNGRFKMYFAGNPYSLFNPVFMGLKVDVRKLKKGEFYVGDIFVIHWATLKEGLKKKLLELNPFYKFDEEYTQYALEGVAINDANIKIGSLPRNFILMFIFKKDGRYLGIYENYSFDDESGENFYCEELENVGKRREVYCYDFEELVERCMIITRADRDKFARFKRALEKNSVLFSSSNVYYLIKEIYAFI